MSHKHLYIIEQLLAGDKIGNYSSLPLIFMEPESIMPYMT